MSRSKRATAPRAPRMSNARRLERNEARLRALAHAAGQITLAFDGAGNATDLTGWCAYTAQSRELAGGRGWLDAIHLEDLPELRRTLDDALAEGKFFELEVRVRRADGVYRAFLMRGLPLLSAKGAIDEWIATCWDISERKAKESEQKHAQAGMIDALLKMAEALVADETNFETSGHHPLNDPAAQRLTELLQLVFDSQRLIVVTIDGETKQLHPLSIIAPTPAEERFWWNALQRSRFGDHLTPEVTEGLTAGEIVLFVPEIHFAAAPLRLLFVPILHNEDLIGFLGLEHSDPRHEYEDEEMALARAVGHLAALIVERRRLTRAREEAESREIASQEAQRRLDEFLSVVSHELRAPLTLIKGSVQLAERRLRRISAAEMDQEDIQERVAGATDLLRRADRQIRIENRLVGDLLDASRIHSDRLDLFLKPTDLATLAGETVEEIRQVHPGRTIRFTVKCATPTIVTIDPDRISQVIVNFLTNALKYSPPGAPIECWLECGREYARLSVRDQGMGISPKEHERIWGRFQRGEYNQRGLGLGLGLYICRNIVERHHGQVGLESIPGQGATFWFTLPLPIPGGEG